MEAHGVVLNFTCTGGGVMTPGVCINAVHDVLLTIRGQLRVLQLPKIHQLCIQPRRLKVQALIVLARPGLAV